MNLHPSARTRRPLLARQRGVTLVELMVGLVIGLLATLVIAQVAIVFEGQKRSTTGGSDAQLNGALALQTLQRDIQLSGYGIATGGGAGCELRGSRNGTVPPWNGQPMVAVRIVDGTDVATGSPDSLFMLFSGKADSSFYSLPIRVYQNHRRDGSEFVLDERTNIGTAQGDMMVVVPTPTPLPSASQVTPSWCSVFNISVDPATTDNRIVHQPGTDGPWNQDSTNTVFPGAVNADTSYAAGSHLVNLGTMTYREYSLSTSTTGSALQMRSVDNNTAQWVTADALFPQIVNLQAVYGRDTSVTRDNVVDAWDNTAPTTADGWSRVIAVRIALVARSNQREKEIVTVTEPTWMPDGVNTQPLKVDHLDSWQHYRYKVFEAAVPLRNMLWQS
ncbi:type IV pilus assembly protein PilW [Leptothrix cholodnii SP-6]|uniref:Type IV pilus assembly protein PilW n=1 Tax=Leptothrix cholodnii (strain ATCC 51168 / LMG 8142 / SP-6) TaxID=395495 RepID=B1XYC7_LEPCP|nr:PilW family protein [Leptothrix cholodnii]ACB35172.1 type IV pilus assembly protein PilW [Leptothrix cholodnii SP-6]